VPVVLRRLLSLVLRLVVIAAGLVFGAVLLVAGLLAALGVIAWALLRGRKPRAVRFGMNRRPPFGQGSPFGDPRRPAAAPADVVDVEAREVPDVARRLPHDGRA
jgi:hypothetical protein